MRFAIQMVAAALSLAIPFITLAQTHAPAGPKYTQVLQMDSMEIAAPALSPNGKWIAFAAGRTYGPESNIWIVPSSGGRPIQLTSGEYRDQQPTWFPESNRLVFRSNRVGGCMTIGIDPSTARIIDPPRRVTLDSAFSCLPSPDGKSLVYSTNILLPISKNPGLLKIVPVSGGTSRTLDSAAVPGDGFIASSFTKDGQFVQYVAGHLNAPEELMRVPVAGGKPILVRRGTAAMIFNGHPAELMFQGLDVAARFRVPPRDMLLIETLSGDSLATIRLRGLRGMQFQQPRNATSRRILLATDNLPGEIHIEPTRGGMPHILRKGSDDALDNFLSDGSMAIETRPAGRTVLEVVSPSGTTTARIQLPDTEQLGYMTNDGKLIYWRNGSVRGVREVSSGRSQPFSHNFVSGAGEDGSRISSRDDDLYIDRVNGNYEFRAFSPLTRTTLIMRTVPSADERGTPQFTAHRGLIAWTTSTGDSTSILVAEGSGSARRLITVRGHHSDGISFSPDGRHLAFGVQVIADRDTSHVIGFADLRPDGTLKGQVHVVRTEGLSDLAWLPNSSEIIYLSVGHDGTTTSLMKLSATPGARPEALTRNEKARFWGFGISPDGKWAAYSAELPNRAAIWRVDLPESSVALSHRH